MNDGGFVEIPFFSKCNIIVIVVLNTARINTSLFFIHFSACVITGNVMCSVQPEMVRL